MSTSGEWSRYGSIDGRASGNIRLDEHRRADGEAGGAAAGEFVTAG